MKTLRSLSFFVPYYGTRTLNEQKLIIKLNACVRPRDLGIAMF